MNLAARVRMLMLCRPGSLGIADAAGHMSRMHCLALTPAHLLRQTLHPAGPGLSESQSSAGGRRAAGFATPNRPRPLLRGQVRRPASLASHVSHVWLLGS